MKRLLINSAVLLGIISSMSLALAACAGSTQTRSVTAVAVACDGYAEVLKQAAKSKSKLSQSQIQTIDRVNKATDVICMPDSPIDPAASVAVVESAIKTVKEILK